MLYVPDASRLQSGNHCRLVECAQRSSTSTAPWEIPALETVSFSTRWGRKRRLQRSFFDACQDAGMYFHPAKKNRDMSGFDLITEALRPASFAVGNEKKTKPRLTIMEGNDEFVWQMSHLRFAEWRGNVTDKDAPEKAQEKRRHLVDCMAYILPDEPRFIDTR